MMGGGGRGVERREKPDILKGCLKIKAAALMRLQGSFWVLRSDWLKSLLSLMTSSPLLSFRNAVDGNKKLIAIYDTR